MLSLVSVGSVLKRAPCASGFAKKYDLRLKRGWTNIRRALLPNPACLHRLHLNVHSITYPEGRSGKRWRRFTEPEASEPLLGLTAKSPLLVGRSA